MKDYVVDDLFDSEEEAKQVLEDSRKKIDELDNDLINVIYERTSLAEDIVKAKTYLGMDIYDASREKNVHEKAQRLATEKNIDKDILDQIMTMLAILSKREQKHILDNLE
ncbi:chorismate mutase [Methanobrevibacter sp. 87.7]|uniref:chorismate mutase n=1 Tax=Methanobrevibacter sp. 87.7 TaxID=387957 RepID=UPI000B50A337|nr:chorismate mutase [Methanobrevibacter sp. 87.7]OWT33249.1 chorismate mutase [Methanobrevibacter sp. 87.7]